MAEVPRTARRRACLLKKIDSLSDALLLETRNRVLLGNCTFRSGPTTQTGWHHWIPRLPPKTATLNKSPLSFAAIDLIPSTALRKMGVQTWFVGSQAVIPRSCNTVSHPHGHHSAVPALGEFPEPQATSVSTPNENKPSLVPGVRAPTT